MRAEELISRAGARGVDLSALTPPRRKHRRAEERRKAERALWRPPQEANGVLPLVADGRPTRVYARPEWTLAEVGQAARDVPRLPYLAATFAFAGDHSGPTYWALWHALHLRATRLCRSEEWSPQVVGVDGRPRFYLCELAGLVLDEDQYAAMFAQAPGLYAIYLGTSEQTWERVLRPRFVAVQVRWLEWLGTAHAIIQPRLSNDAFQ